MKQSMKDMLTKFKSSKQVTREQEEGKAVEDMPRIEAADGVEGDEDMVDNQPGTIGTTNSSCLNVLRTQGQI